MDADPILGIRYEMPDADYRAVDAVSQSILKVLKDKTPRHALAAMTPRDEDDKVVDAGDKFDVGTVTHCALLEPDAFAARYRIGPNVNKNTTAWRKFVDDTPPGVRVIDAKTRDEAFERAAALREIPEVRDALKTGWAEASVFWMDDVTGLMCKGRPDWIRPYHPNGAVLMDVKTARDASRRAFAKACAEFNYAIQGEWYAWGFEQATGMPVLGGMLFAVVESSPPYCASAYVINEGQRAMARRECRRLLDRFARCKASGSWPGYPDGLAEELVLPDWWMRQMEEASYE